MDFYNTLKMCEPSISQIARDAGISRQAVNGYRNGALPNRKVFDILTAQSKYAPLRSFVFEELKKLRPVGRPAK